MKKKRNKKTASQETKIPVVSNSDLKVLQRSMLKTLQAMGHTIYLIEDISDKLGSQINQK